MARVLVWVASVTFGISTFMLGTGMTSAMAGGYERRATTCTAACRQARIGAHHSALKRNNLARGAYAYGQDYERPYQYLYRPGEGAIALSPSVGYEPRNVDRKKDHRRWRKQWTGCYRTHKGHILHCRTQAQRVPKSFKKAAK